MTKARKTRRKNVPLLDGDIDSREEFTLRSLANYGEGSDGLSIEDAGIYRARCGDPDPYRQKAVDELIGDSEMGRR